MFNVCSQCGTYSDEPEVEGAVATCPTCHHRTPFKKLPLFIAGGASGTGKTTLALALAGRLRNVVVLDQDILWMPEMADPEAGWRRFRNLWLRVAKSIHQSGRSVLLFGTAGPDQYELCPERRFIGNLNYLHLVCQDEILAERLRARPAWRKESGETIAQALKFNQWLRENGIQRFEGARLLDTTSLSVEQAASEIGRWVDDHSQK